VRDRTEDVANPNIIPLPAFAAEEYRPYEMRQLVAALEHRLQGLETDPITTQSTGSTSTDTSDLDARFAALSHLHSESEISNLRSYLLNINSESIFDLADVAGNAELDEILKWDGSRFVAVPSSQSVINLADLNDVALPDVLSNDTIFFNGTTQQWEATPLVSGGSTVVSGTIQTKVKQNFTDIDTNAVPQVDTDLSGFVLKQWTWYKVTADMHFIQNLGDFRFQINEVGGVFSLPYGQYQKVAFDGTGGDDFTNDWSLAQDVTGGTDNIASSVTLIGSVNSATATGAEFRWSQATSHANATRLFQGSWVSFEEIGPAT